MNIFGLQKLTLLDYPGNLACTVFLGGCNFKCPFCQNASLVLCPDRSEQVREDEFFDFISRRKGRLQGVCITGGEPTLSPELLDFMKKIKDHGFKVKLDTNGYRPEVLEKVLHLALADMVAMDIKASRPKYAAAAGVPGLDISRIESSVSILRNSGIDYEFRTTVVEELHSASDFEEIGLWLAGSKHYYLQSFRDSQDIIGGSGVFHACDIEKLKSYRNILLKTIPGTELRGIEE